MSQAFFTLIFACLVLGVVPSGSYAQGETFFGQAPPGEVAEPFAPSVLTVEPHDSPIIAPDEEWLLLQSMGAGILFYGMVDTLLTEIANPLGFEIPDLCNGVAISPSGTRLYIELWRNGQTEVYYVDKVGDSWSSLTYIPALDISTNWWQISVVSSGAIYLASDTVMVSYLEGDTHATPVPLKLEDNSDMVGNSPYVSPDESYIVYSIDGDLHISYRRSNGKWTMPEDLGPNVNSEQLDHGPQVTPDGKYMLFSTRRHGSDFVVYWVDAGFTNCCLPPTLGDVNQSGGVDITDIQVLVDNQFLSLTPLICDQEGDIDISGEVDITDLSLLIDNQFISLEPLPACPSLAGEVLQIPHGASVLVDGELSSGEWDDAEVRNLGIAGVIDVTVRIKHDGANLLAAYEYSFLADENLCFPEMLIDVGMDMAESWAPDDWWFHVSGSDCEAHGTYDVWGDCAIVQPDWLGVPNFAMVPEPPVLDTFEVSIPFSKIGVAAGDSVGLAFRIEYFSVTQEYAYWPSDAAVATPSTWGAAALMTSP